MCGILGAAFPTGSKYNKDKINLLTYYNQERGKDSLGYYNNIGGITKKIGKPVDLMASKSIDIEEDSILIGHVRAATVGSVLEKNAHPFIEGSLVLAMNGTLSNHSTLCTKYGFEIKDFDVDSHILCAIINKEKNFNVLSEMIGGCALIMYETEKHGMYIYRNTDRPLYRGKLDGGMYFSSTDTPLKVIGCDSIKEFKQDYLYTIKEGKIISVEKIKRFEPPKPVGSQGTLPLFVTTYASLYTRNVNELIGKYIKVDDNVILNAEEKSFGIKQGHSYKLIRTSYDKITATIETLCGQVETRKFIYSQNINNIVDGSQVFAINDLCYTGGNKENFCKKGDLMEVCYVYEDNNDIVYNIYNPNTFKTADVRTKDIKFAYPLEIEAYRDSISNSNKEFVETNLGKPDEKNIIQSEPLEIADITPFEYNEMLEQATYEDSACMCDELMSEADIIIQELRSTNEVKMYSKVDDAITKLESIINKYNSDINFYRYVERNNNILLCQ